MIALKCHYAFPDYPDEQPCFTLVELEKYSSQGINLLSPNFPANYDNSEFCYWIIEAPEDKVVELEFVEWDVSTNSIKNIHIRNYTLCFIIHAPFVPNSVSLICQV